MPFFYVSDYSHIEGQVEAGHAEARSSLIKEKGGKIVGEAWNKGYVTIYRMPIRLTKAEEEVLCLIPFSVNMPLHSLNKGEENATR